jgi:septal ring factor EnvC (AmiA/AmiB activator)
MSLYGHVQTAASEVGDTVKAGDTVATAGSSGGHDESGVYFEIRKGTTAVDPKSWLAQ